MNIFFLSLCAKRCAQYHFDSHVIKMILELTQLLSTAWHVLNRDEATKLLKRGLIYRKTHQNHPCAVWTRAHINNYAFVVNLAQELCKEWRYRWSHGRIHKCEPLLDFLTNNPPLNISESDVPKTRANPHGFTFPMPQAMPADCRYRPSSKNAMNCCIAYKRYYRSRYKSKLRKWSIVNPRYVNDRETPDEPKRISLGAPSWF